jgi:putative peptide zinc metalloprotease protein
VIPATSSQESPRKESQPSADGEPHPNKDAIYEAISRLPIGLRGDLEVSRQITNSGVQYVLRDPLTFASCALSNEDYQVFLHLEPKQTVLDAYQKLSDAGIIAADQREEFYQFMIDLHRRNLIRLPILDGNLLYRAYSERRTREFSSLPLRLLSYQFPLLNPDRFLRETQRFVRPLFQRWFLLVWIALAGIASYVVAVHWKEFTDSAASLLALRSFPVLVLLLCVLKVIHELGHAYACKLYGGNVPEMGLIFILGTPCAYVDTSAAWGFRDRWQRIVVNLSGMYFESLIAILAVFAWVSTPPGLLHSIAHYTIVLSTAMTIVFNANPLLKFDGYYVLSDYLGIPNLKRIASTCFMHSLKRNCLGMELPRIGSTVWHDRFLSLFGAASEAYRFLIVVGIVTFLVLQVPAIGLTLGLMYLFVTMLPGVDRLTRYLFWHPDTVSRRPRVLCVIVGAAIVLGVVLFTPIATTISVLGIVGRENETFIRATESGLVSKVGFKPAERVESGELLFELSNEELQSRFIAARTDATKLRTQWIEALQKNPPEAAMLMQKLRQAELNLDAVEKAVDRLTIRAPEQGVLTEWQTQDFVGRFLKPGEPLVKLESGKWIVRALATDEEILDSQLVEEDPIDVEIIGQPGKRLHGRVVSVSQASQERIEESALTQFGGGDISIDPYSQKASQSYFLITMELDTIGNLSMRSGIRVQAMVPNRKWSLGRSLSRKFWQFYHRYLLG